MKFRIKLIALLPVLVLMFCGVARGQQGGANFNPELKLEEAIRKIEEGDIEGAKRDFMEATRVTRKSEKLKLAQGLYFLKSNQPMEAIPLLQDYNKTPEGTQDHRGQAALGRMYKDSKMYNVAISYLNAAKRVAPTGMVNGKNVKAEIILDLAMCYHGLKKSKQALEEAKEAEKLAGGDPNIQLQLSEVALDAKDFDLAMKSADTSISLFRNLIITDPLKKKNYESMVMAQLFKIKVGINQAQEQPREAKPYYDVAVATKEAAEIKRLIGLLESREIILDALKKEQKDSPLLVTMKLFAARAEIELRAFQDADERIAEVLRNDPNNKEAQDLRAQITGKTGLPKIQ
jgi:tetratricopeptide (TPR) repeat protein